MRHLCINIFMLFRVRYFSVYKNKLVHFLLFLAKLQELKLTRQAILICIKKTQSGCGEIKKCFAMSARVRLV